MSLIKRVVLLQVFDEDGEKFAGPLWAVSAFLLVSLLNLFAVFAVVYVVVTQPDMWMIPAYAALTGGVAVLCGLLWECGLRNRAKNGLLLVLFVNAVLLLR